MDRIARATEPDLRYGEWLFTRTDQATQDVADSVAQGAVGAVYRLGLKALVVPTNSGRTARLVSAHRPNVPVLAVSPVHRDGAPAQPPVRRHRGAERLRDRAAQPARPLRRARRPATASPRPASWSRSPPASTARNWARTCSRSIGCRSYEPGGATGARGERPRRADPRQPAAEPLRPADDRRPPGGGRRRRRRAAAGAADPRRGPRRLRRRRRPRLRRADAGAGQRALGRAAGDDRPARAAAGADRLRRPRADPDRGLRDRPRLRPDRRQPRRPSSAWSRKWSG